ncbi:hypothetical protein IFM89_021485 [Coptis chinensis]|uniref:Major facilitator superfamily (MFS) profile domain-containing protein n=1 Tax=Coptis chinensis TaxID=261450 RepID=A0A835MF32_9MAGN|nr:hypothetical protein IFM89_021485 [Coptis chinensis]
MDVGNEVKVTIEYGLCEVFNRRNLARAPEHGKNVGFNVSELEAMFPDGTVETMEPICNQLPDWHERPESAKLRYATVIRSLAKRFPYENLLLVTHKMGVKTAVSSFRKDKHGVEKGWAPFDGSDGTSILGEIDLAFLSVYSLGMYFSGHLGDRLDLRIFLTIGMVGTGLFTMLFGFGYWLNIHSFYYFLIIQTLAGLFQSTGWPSAVAVIGNWFRKKKRGLIMGIWNAHTSIGNISGSLIASYFLEYGWGWSFAIPGLLTIILGMIVFLLLPKKEVTKEQPVGFIQAWRIPGVAPYAL